RSTIRTIVDRADESDSVASAIRSSVIKSVGQRDIGKGECSRILFSGSHVESTFKYVYVSTDLETQEIVRSSRTGNLSKSKSLLQCFAERHNLQESHPTLDLDQPNLIEFCKQFVLVKGELRKNPDADKTIVITFPNFRYAPKSPQYKQFCRSSLLKYSPWTATTVTVIKNDITVVEQWESFVATCSENQRKYFNTDLELKKMLKTVLDDIHLDDVEEEVTRKQELWQKISNMRPPIENASPQLDPIVDKTFDWIKDTVIEYLPSFLTTAPQWIQKNSTSISNPSELLKELPVVYRDSLNERQRKWYDLVIDRYKSSTPLRLIVTGTAGTGKSHTISAISHAIPPENLIRSAFTAQAAFQIRGSTLHKTFHLPVESGGRQFDLLNGEAAANLEKEFSKVKVVIIDEFSMLSQPILGKIDKRLKQAKGNSEPFGGVSVILVGDPAQLPPVGGTPLHGSIEKDFGGKAAYQSFKHVIKLEEIKRQAVKEGDFEQQRFVDILSELREGRCSLEDWQFLQKRNPESIPDFEVRYADAVRLFSTNEKVDEYNTRKLNQLKKPITLIKAKNSTKTARSLASDKFRGLKNDLYLAVGAKVTLVTNLWSSCGLTNGGKGTIVDIVYPTGSQPNIDQPSFIVVHFPEFTGPQFFPVDQDHEYRNCIPVAPVTIFTDDYRHSRTQFPLRLAYAMTIHKAQGKTLEQVVVDLGATEMTQGLTFVALSRVTHINSLCIIDHSYERLKRLANSETLRPRKEEEARLNALAVNTLLLI
ncbi:MAG: ATP-dependent RecD-like DNA helicase, partial [bacterium]